MHQVQHIVQVIFSKTKLPFGGIVSCCLVQITVIHGTLLVSVWMFKQLGQMKWNNCNLVEMSWWFWSGQFLWSIKNCEKWSLLSKHTRRHLCPSQLCTYIGQYQASQTNTTQSLSQTLTRTGSLHAVCCNQVRNQQVRTNCWTSTLSIQGTNYKSEYVVCAH